LTSETFARRDEGDMRASRAVGGEETSGWVRDLAPRSRSNRRAWSDARAVVKMLYE
jgi:hypothetical protein